MWLRKLAWTLVIVAFGAYQVAAAVEQRSLGGWRAPEPVHQATWLAKWDMFTFTPRTHVVYGVEHVEDGQWVPTPLGEAFPFRWCHGERWQRPTFADVRVFRELYLEAACDLTGAAQVRGVRHVWRATPGSWEQPRSAGAKRDVLQTWTCGRRAPRAPRGRVI